MRRREFLALALLAACESNNNAADLAIATDCVANGTRVTIGSNHGHILVVPKEDVSAGLAKSYDISGTAGHAHQVSLSPSDFASLKGNQGLQVTSTPGVGHTHPVTIVCA